MALNVRNVAGQVFLNGQAVPNGTSSGINSSGDYISIGATSQAAIVDQASNVTVAIIDTTGSPTPTMQTFGPYAQSVYQVYYNGSYRWQVNSPGGSVGTRI